MSLVSGALSMSRFEIHFEKRRPSYSWSQLNHLIDPWKAPPLSLARKIAPEIAGWVFPTGSKSLAFLEDDLPPDHPWDLEMCAINGMIALRLRVEKRQVPNQLLQELYKNELYHYIAKFGQTPKPAEKKQIKQEIQDQLAQRALPNVQYIDGLWFMDEHVLWVMSTGKRLKDAFIDQFTKTFLTPLKGVALETTAPLLALKKVSTENQEDVEVMSQTLKLLSSAVPISLAPNIHYGSHQPT